MPRQARLVAGTLHHVILRGIEKRQLFDDALDRENFVTRMGQLTIETGFPLAEIARRLGVSTSAISQVLRRRTKTKSI